MSKTLQASELFIPDALSDIDSIVEELDNVGAASRPLLQEETRQRLIEEAYALKWSSCSRFSSASIPEAVDNHWNVFSASFFDYLQQNCPQLFRQTLAKSLFKYKQDQYKEAHSDTEFTYIFNIDGDGAFNVYDVIANRLANRVDLDTSPGTIILLDGAGRPNTKRPTTKYHGIDNIRSRRLSLVVY